MVYVTREIRANPQCLGSFYLSPTHLGSHRLVTEGVGVEGRARSVSSTTARSRNGNRRQAWGASVGKVQLLQGSQADRVPKSPSCIRCQHDYTIQVLPSGLCTLYSLSGGNAQHLVLADVSVLVLKC